jgi:hypothetical protein
MRLLIFGLLGGLLAQPGLLAAEPRVERLTALHARLSTATPIADAVANSVARDLGAAGTPRTEGGLPGQQAEPERSWISCHPALFGAMVGAGGGAVVGATAGHECSEESWCQRGATTLIGAGIGAGAGALIGWGIGLAAK